MALCRVLAVLMAVVALGFADQPRTRENPVTPGWPCPIDTEISPCVCSQDELYNLYMDCSLAKSDEQLERIFTSVFPFPDFYELRIIHDRDDIDNVIDEINPNTFAELTFERVIITGTRLTEIIDEAFADSHATLNYLDLSSNYLHTFPFESLPLYVQLNTFIIDDNQFPELYNLESQSLQVFSANKNPGLLMNSDHHFSGVPNLRELYLSEIGLKELTTGLFSNMTQLQVVDFSRNYLTELEAGSIAVSTNTIKKINFDLNDIFFVRHDALVGFAEDGSLSMASNQIVELPEEHWKHIFEQLKSRESIDLRGNALTCGCDIDWLFMQYDQEYLCRLTDTTLCYASTQQVIFLDVDIFCVQCAASFGDCPPQTDCKNPGTF
ncbi:oplophorus-luciferin 2-monooxygenase non-catalytic subunit-like [Eriocheir sinensis]|uniref:oplophorus-luciferin 2-monooxygenase non-catalytic subunit-like n=1 Tax=Eriocheir sinensis TaxID=95602 RepID=UPI0021C61194|nr:oplophorus-luciferin 2-monooxygenase non-catalytic subunit-like [Eriocheir sinensis]XP_050705668.1 oplophorus-luciferin 2-monooxygenase non-catalytic subunit-like [Eriocheir sinensis]